MSKLSDYSKFDHIDDESDEDNDVAPQPNLPLQGVPPPPVASVAAATGAPSTGTATMVKDEATGRYTFIYNGAEVYQWEQTLDDVTIYVTAPPHVTKGSQVSVQIQATHLKLGLVGGSQWFLDEPTFGTVDVSESTWSLEDEEDSSSSSRGETKIITIYLTKAHRGELWDAALKGNMTVQLDPLAKEDAKKKLMLERFQEEHPGFDFRDAEFNGGVPDARSFMGGVKYSK